MKKQILIILTALLLIATPAFAAKDATESAAEEIRKKVKEQLEKPTNEDNNDENNEDQENSDKEKQSTKYHAWVGSLAKTENSVLYINTDEGEKQAEIDEDAVILQTEKGKSRKEVDKKDLLEGNFILAMGTLKDDIITAKRIISTPPADQPNKTLIYGKVSEIDDKAIKLSNGQQNTLPINEDETALSIKGAAKPIFVDIQLEDKLYAITIVENDEIKKTLSIFVIPGKYNPENEQNQIEEEATPSAESTESAEKE